jgi:hypothetical protein
MGEKGGSGGAGGSGKHTKIGVSPTKMGTQCVVGGVGDPANAANDTNKNRITLFMIDLPF